MENVQARGSLHVNRTNSPSEKKTTKKNASSSNEHASSYMEQLQRAKAERIAAEQKRQQRRDQPLSQEGAKVSRASAEEMLNILSMLSENN